MQAEKQGFIQICQMVGAPRPADLVKPWFLVETYFTSEGMRTRVCSGRWATMAEAQTVLDARQQEINR